MKQLVANCYFLCGHFSHFVPLFLGQFFFTSLSLLSPRQVSVFPFRARSRKLRGVEWIHFEHWHFGMLQHHGILDCLWLLSSSSSLFLSFDSERENNSVSSNSLDGPCRNGSQPVDEGSFLSVITLSLTLLSSSS